MAGETLHLSMLLTAQADQARRELGATAQAARELGKAGPEITGAMGPAKAALDGAAQAALGLRSVAPAVARAFAPAKSELSVTATAANTLQGAVGGLNRDLRRQSADLVATARETAQYRGELETLRAQFNPLFAASKAYEQTLRDIADAERLGALSAAEAEQARTRAAAGLTPMTTGMNRLGQITSVNVMHSANLAAQFNDIGVMAMAMQNPLQLALQQGTQINQVFGQMGGHRTAIRQIGPALLSIVNPASLATIAVIALGTAGVQWLLSLQTEALSVDEVLADLDESLTALREASRFATPGGLDQAEERYGRVTAAVERLIAARERLAVIDARAELQALGGAVAERAGSRWYDLGVSDEASGILALRRNLDLGRRDAEILRAEIVRLGSLREPADLADQYGHLAGMIEAVIAELGPTDERRQFLADLLEGEDRARQIVAILEARGQHDTRQGQLMLADLQSELAIRQAINAYGDESARVTELRIDAERRAFEEQLRTLDVSDETKSALREAWEAANGLAAINLSAGIAAARDRAREMADEIARAVEGVQSLAQQGAGALEEARIRAGTSDPVEQARRLAEARMRRVQAPLRGGAEGLDLAALDAQVRLAGNEAAEVARLNAERERLNRTRRDGARASAQEREAVEELITNLQTELDVLRETDPVQQEMIRQREVLAAATAEERDEIQELIRLRNEETNALAENQRHLEGLRDIGRDVLRGMIADLREGASAGEILGNVLERLADRLIDMGASSLSDILFGRSGSSSSGWLGSLIRGLFGGAKANALGDVVGSPTLFAYGDGTDRLGVMGEAGAEAIMPLTHSMGEGVGAVAAGIETTLPLTRLASGKLGVQLPPEPFALGDTFGPVPAPPSRTARAAGTDTQAARGEIVGRLEVVHSRDFEVRWAGLMQRVAVDVTEQGLLDYDRNLPARMERIGLDPALRG